MRRVPEPRARKVGEHVRIQAHGQRRRARVGAPFKEQLMGSMAPAGGRREERAEEPSLLYGHRTAATPQCYTCAGHRRRRRRQAAAATTHPAGVIVGAEAGAEAGGRVGRRSLLRRRIEPLWVRGELV